jgi:putative ABC transport system permease protein
MTAVVHTDGDPADLFPPARERLRAVVPTVPGTLRTLDSLLADSFRDRTFTLGVLGAFAVLSLLLSAVGIYGVVSYTVSSRAREIGILLALGAERGGIRAGMFFRSIRGVLVGIVLGVGLAVLFGGVLESLLYEVEPRDPMTLTVAPMALLVAASVAILVPVVRHTRIDPVQAMKVE